MRMAVLAVGWASGRVPWGDSAAVAGQNNPYQAIKWSQEGEKAVYAACFSAYIVGLIGETVVIVVGARLWYAWT